METLKFLWGEPALLAGGSLIISDMHLGIELEYRREGMSFPSQTENLQKRLDRLLSLTKAKNTIICGDFKHKVPGSSFQERREIPLFLEHFCKKTTIEIALGNHDTDLRHIISGKNVALHPPTGFLRGKLFFFHGHSWPHPDFLSSDFIIAGHIQPHIEIQDRLGYRWRNPVWVRAPLLKKEALKKYPAANHLPELIILPAFNPLAGGLALNKKGFDGGRSPILQMTDLKKAEIFLLDGTFLGELGTL